LISWGKKSVLKMLKNAPSIYSKSMLEHLLKNDRAFLKEHMLFNVTEYYLKNSATNSKFLVW